MSLTTIKHHLQGGIASMFFACIAMLLFSACQKEHKHLICIYNTQAGYWRTQMSEEMIYEAAQHPNVKLVFRTKQSGDETEDEMNALEYFISLNPDAIIFVSDNYYLRNHFRQAQMKGIPIILLNNSDSKATYTARITNNNVKAGQDAAHYLIDRLQGKGRILMIKGESASSDDRTKGFYNVVDSFPDIHIVDTLRGFYSLPIAKEKVKEFLQQTDLSQPIDAVFAQNDRMAIGAHEAFGQIPETAGWNTLFFGIDGLMCDSVGVERLLDGTISTSMLLPTGGREAIQQAVNIIEGRPFTRNIELDAHIITRDSVAAMRKRWNAIVQKYEKATNSQTQTELRQKRYSRLEVLVWFVLIALFALLVACVWLFRLARAYRKRIEELTFTNDIIKREKIDLLQQQNILEAERRLLTEQRDRWFDLRSSTEEVAEIVEEEPEPSTFRSHILGLIRKHMGDEACNVETLSEEMNLSRVQLNRKVKAEFDMSPGDLLRKTRMEHAVHLLRTTDLTISEVSYRVGFTDSKYFSRCFKEYFDNTPSEIRRGKGIEG